MLLSCSVFTVVSQTCPSYTAGFTGDSEIHSSAAGAIYVNDAPAHHAPCDGTVYAWHYCYYPVSNPDPDGLELAFGVYNNPAHNQYTLRPGSHYLFRLPSQGSVFTCGTVNLNASQYFQIYMGDRVGACMRSSANNVGFLNILAHNASGNVTVVWGQNSAPCTKGMMMESGGPLQTVFSLVLHLHVDISKIHLLTDFRYTHF